MPSAKLPGGFVTKRALIDKANTTMLIAAGFAAFLVVFSLVSAKSLVSQLMYQNRVINEKRATLDRIKENLDARDKLVDSYDSFVSSSTNLIGGNSQATGDRNGSNSKIVLDALPPRYDFPAMAASLEKLTVDQGLTLKSIAGTDDEEVQGAQTTSAVPKAVPMEFQLTVNGGYSQVQGLVTSFEKSIRPIKITMFSVTSSDSGLKTDISGQTYYQPEKKLELTKKVVK